MSDPTDTSRWKARARAAGVVLVGAWMLLLGTPGLDYAPNSELRSPQDRAHAVEQFGVFGSIGVALMDFERDVREPVAKKLGGIQRVFRIRQSWHLYRNGPPKVRRLEIRVDGERVYLTGSSTHTWRRAQLRNRRMRPVAETTVQKPEAKNTTGFVRWVTAEARGDFPDAQRVEVRAFEGPYPGERLTLRHAWTVDAPDWKAELTRVQGKR